MITAAELRKQMGLKDSGATETYAKYLAEIHKYVDATLQHMVETKEHYCNIDADMFAKISDEFKDISAERLLGALASELVAAGYTTTCTRYKDGRGTILVGIDAE